MKKIITALLTGLGLGALVGILFAPHSGKRTRKLIQNSVDDLKLEARRQVYRLEVAMHDFQEIDWEELEEKAAGEIRGQLKHLATQLEALKKKL